MALTSMQLVNRALVKIAAAPIDGFEDGSTESLVAATLYASTRDALISAHPWSFATAQRRLNRLVGRPVADFDYAYQLPADFLRALSAGLSNDGRGLDYRIVERRLHTNAEEVTLSYIFRPMEPAFPPFFDEALIARLSAEFCLPITESTTRTEALNKLAENAFRRARIIDAQQDTPVRFEGFSLTGVRN
ncbi:MAG: hypothetical protein NXI21_17335 [Alphaproteobacteria bacterium]|nr:hypothetical protein [Alphaproteobacteria bacterium]